MEEKTQKYCFVVMPISDSEGYETGHFSRVYEYLIKPACTDAGLVPIRADDVKATNYIVLDILHRILNSAIVICDLSGRNPNVLYELGIRQAFDLPVVLIKDRKTERVFDIQGLRTIDYDESLRVDTVRREVESLRSALQATSNPASHDVNSLVTLLGIPKAQVSTRTEISSDTALILSSIKDISERLAFIEDSSPREKEVSYARVKRVRTFPSSKKIALPSGDEADPNATVYDGSGNELGELISVDSEGIAIKSARGAVVKVSPDDSLYTKITTLPF